MVVVGLWGYFSGFLVSDFFVVLHNPINLVSSLTVKGCKRIAKEGKEETKIPFNSKPYFRV